MKINSKIIVALDVDSLDKAKKLTGLLYPKVKIFKIGLAMISSGDALELVKYIHKLGGRVFYDGKFNDIPNTVGMAAKAVSKLGIDMFTVHVSAGAEALRAAVRNKGRAKVIGVTVLTSIKDSDCRNIFGVSSDKKVVQFAGLLLKEKADGIVCSAKEAVILRNSGKFNDLKIITPGIRPSWSLSGDQSRAVTPKEAVSSGADYLVIGRPVTSPSKNIGGPIRALDRILKEIA